MYSRLSCLLIISFLFASCASNPLPNQAEKPLRSFLGLPLSPENISHHLDKAMQARKIQGLSFALINEGQVVYQQLKGYADVAQKKKVDSLTIFETASMSKPVFAYFVMKLVEQGKLDLDKPLYQYWPYPDIAYDERYKKITARMVLANRTGFPNWRHDFPEKKLFLQFDPGTQYFYSGEGFQYLARVVKELYESNWEGVENAFQATVAQPLQMEHSRFIQDDYIRKHKSQPYNAKGHWIDKSKIKFWVENDSVFIAAGNLHSNVQNYAKWMQAILEGEGLSEQGMEDLLSPHSLITQVPFLYSAYYCLGIVQINLPWGQFYFHDGNNTGFTGMFILNRPRKWGMILLSNSDQYGGEVGINLALELMTGYSIYKLGGIAALWSWALLTFIITGLGMIFSKTKSALAQKIFILALSTLGLLPVFWFVLVKSALPYFFLGFLSLVLVFSLVYGWLWGISLQELIKQWQKRALKISVLIAYTFCLLGFGGLSLAILFL